MIHSQAKSHGSQSVSLGLWLRTYFSLTKPTITLLVVVTAIPAMVLASPLFIPSAFLMFITLLGAGLSSASAAVFNQVVEIDTDQKMYRTTSRSLPSGKVSKVQASLFGTVLGALGLFVLYTWATPLAAAVALAGHIFYVVIYTMYLKPRTPQNIVIGGAAGAVGPLIGSAAISGTLTLDAWLMFLLIFMWTPPNFWSLAIKYKDDYARAGVPMYPVIYGNEKTRREILLYSIGLFPVVWGFYFYGSGELGSLIAGTLLTVQFLRYSVKLYRSRDDAHAMPLFHFSCIYTFAIFAFWTVEGIWMRLG